MATFERSLWIGFGNDASHALLRAEPGHESGLGRLALRFATRDQRSPTSIEIEIDDLLANLSALANWPDPAGVEWETGLKTLVADTVADADRVSRRLEPSGATDLEVDAAQVPQKLGPKWKGNLTEFQLRDIAKLLSLRHGANFSVPGAGKTRVSLAVFEALRAEGLVDRLLIVGPKSSYEAWLGENEECLADPLRMRVLNRHPDPGAEALIVNYERLSRSEAELGRWLAAGSSMLLLDEAHRMKRGADGTYGSSCLALGPLARRRLILTGTPAPNGVRDLENLFGFVWPGYGRTKVTQAVAGGDLAKASKVLQPLFTRTTKKELQLPPVSTRLQRVEMPPLHREIYNALVGQFSARASTYEDDLRKLGKPIVYLLMAATSPALLSVGSTRFDPLEYRVPPLAVPEDSDLFRLMSDLPNYELSPKYSHALKIVAENAAQGRKTLVWSTFIRSLNTMQRLMDRYSPALVHGGTEDRDEQIKRFREDSDCMVLLSNPATLGEGISLHKECHDAVYIDRDFAAGRFLQSLDRIHRLGLDADTATNVVVLASEASIDEVVAQRLGTKLDFMGGILDDAGLRALGDLSDDEPVSGGLDPEDVQALIGHLSASSS